MREEAWNPEIEEDDNILDEAMAEQIEIAEGYGDFLIAQKKAGVFKKPTKTNKNQRFSTNNN